MALATTEAAQEEITREQRHALLKRIAESSQLKRAARLRQFLLYVGQRSIDEGSPGIHEQEIGAFVFGRAEGYDTNLDNIVRVNATELRKRLEAFFTLEGSHERIVLEIPRGSYTPVFHRRLVVEIGVAAAAAPVDMPPVSESVSPRESLVDSRSQFRPDSLGRFFRILLGFVFVVLMACSFLLWQNLALRRHMQPWKGTPALASFWVTFMDSSRDTDIILADTSFALAEDISKREFTLDDYLNYSYKDVAQSPTLSADQQTDVRMDLQRNNGSIGDFKVAQQILALDPISTRLKLEFAREYTPPAIKHDNVILIGSTESNPWVGLFDPQLNFSVHYDAAHHSPYIVNRHPRAGEQSIYQGGSWFPNGSGYSVIAFIPNLNRTGNVVILEGTVSQATEAAGDFITSEPAMSKFKSVLPPGSFPYFEVLLRTSHLVGTSLQSEVVAYRTHSRSNGVLP